MSAAEREPLLAVRGVHTYYGSIAALKGVDIDVHAGEIVALIGANGAGKSTLMMTICGNPRAREGRILFDGHDITALATHDIAALKIAQAPEGRRIFARMTVLENLQMGAIVGAPADFDGDLERVFGLFPRLKERLHQRGGTLSGGEQQMLAIARALMSRPRLLLLDEPSLGLAPLIVRQIFDAIRDAQQRGKADRVPGGTERLSCPEARPPRLCHGQRRDHAVRQRPRPAQPRRGQGRLSRRRTAIGETLMSGILYDDVSFGTFLLVTFLMGGAAAWLSGRAIALDWRPYWQVVLAGFVLAAALRFIHFALFGATFLSLQFYLVDSAICVIFGLAGYRVTRAGQMATQYGFIARPAEPPRQLRTRDDTSSQARNSG